MANLSGTTLYKDIRRLADRCRVVFDCLDFEYDLDEIVLDYVIYRCVKPHHLSRGDYFGQRFFSRLGHAAESSRFSDEDYFTLVASV